MNPTCVTTSGVFDLPPPENVFLTIELLNKGLPTSCFERLSEAAGISPSEVAAMARISLRTLQRRRKEGTFTVEEGERVLRLMRVMERATELFGDQETAAAWLKKPGAAFEGKSPLAFADTEPGAQFVTQVIGRLEHGVFG